MSLNFLAVLCVSDDFLFLSESSAKCIAEMETFIDLCRQTGFMV